MGLYELAVCDPSGAIGSPVKDSLHDPLIALRLVSNNEVRVLNAAGSCRRYAISGQHRECRGVQGLDTRIVPGTACHSSCPYVLAGGRRASHFSGWISRPPPTLIRHAKSMPVVLAVEGIQRGQGKTMRHLIEMGIDPGVMIHSLTTPPNDIYLLVESELIESRMATEVTN